MPVELYHGSSEIIEYPQIRKTKYTKDFSWRFYCTKSYEQAKRWAARRHENGTVNFYSYYGEFPVEYLEIWKYVRCMVRLHCRMSFREDSWTWYCRGAHGRWHHLEFCKRFYKWKDNATSLLGVCKVQASNPSNKLSFPQSFGLPNVCTEWDNLWLKNKKMISCISVLWLNM